MKYWIIFLAIILYQYSCKEYQTISIVSDNNETRITGEEYYKIILKMNWKMRDSLALIQFNEGNVPDFLKKFTKIKTSITDSLGKIHKAYYYVSTDYLSIGTNSSWARVPLTPQTAQIIANKWNCFLPTKKIVDEIYHQAVVKLEPVPMYIYRDSSITMWQHHLIIEGQRKNRKGLIAGIKKDVVISEKIFSDSKPNRVAIYGWHQSNGKPIQPLYTGHVNWYVDYSHGIRLVYRKIYIDGKEYDYLDMLKHPIFKHIICDETNCNMYFYTTE